MKYVIKAVDRKTGKPIPDITVDAKSEDDAIQYTTSAFRILVESVTEKRKTQDASGILNEVAAVRSEALEPVESLRHPTRTRPRPEYKALEVIGGPYAFFGFVIVLISLATAVVISFRQMADWQVIGLTLAVVITGAGFLAVGQLLHRFRDIARNSRKLNQIAEGLERRAEDG